MMNCHIDFAFLDGKHWSEFLLRDFINTERNCHRNSIIALHDCLPVEAAIADRIPNQRPTIVAHRAGWWAGDVWRTALLLKRKRPDLHMLTLDAKPTGLVLISNLDPESGLLSQKLADFEAEMHAWSLDEIGLGTLFAELAVQSTSAIASADQIRARWQFGSI